MTEVCQLWYTEMIVLTGKLIFAPPTHPAVVSNLSCLLLSRLPTTCSSSIYTAAASFVAIVAFTKYVFMPMPSEVTMMSHHWHIEMTALVTMMFHPWHTEMTALVMIACSSTLSKIARSYNFSNLE